MNKLIYQKKYTYTVMNRTCFDEIAPWSVLDIFQDVASGHVEEYHLCFDGMLSKGLIWVLVRTKYQVINDPKPSNKELYVTTWQSEQARADFTRDYIIKDKDGNILIKGSSKWCLIDINTRRIAPTKSLGIDITHNEFLFSEAFGKLNFDSLKENDTECCLDEMTNRDFNYSFNSDDENSEINDNESCENGDVWNIFLS